MKNLLKVILGCALLLAFTGCGGGGSKAAIAANPTPTPQAALSVSPNPATVPVGGTLQFTVKAAAGAPPAVNWSVNGTQGGSATAGTIDQNGNFTAPGSFPSGKEVTVTATTQSSPATTINASAIIVNNASAQISPILLGTTGGNVTDSVSSAGTTTCCSGTLGSLLSRGGTQFVLSNNHVLDKSGQGTTGDAIGQPGLVDNNCSPGATVANLSQAAALKPANGTNGNAPSNVDAAIAQVAVGKFDPTGSILDLGAAGASSTSNIAAAPPSATLAAPGSVLAVGEGVAKSGRSSGLTCSTLTSVSTNISVDYGVSCGGPKAFTAIFQNQVVVNGGNFSDAGDSGSLVVTSDTARPVGLLYAGNSTSTTANPIADVLNTFSTPGNPATIVGGGDHAVSCAAVANSGLATPASATLSAAEIERAALVQQKYAADLMKDPAIAGVAVGSSADNPREAALIVSVHEGFNQGAANKRIPAQIEGVRTQVTGSAARPVLSPGDLARTTAVKEARAPSLMEQAGVMGVGVGRSEDNPSEPALIVFVETGKLESPLPAEIDGVRTRIVEGDRFRAFGWGRQPAAAAAACAKKPTGAGPKNDSKNGPKIDPKNDPKKK